MRVTSLLILAAIVGGIGYVLIFQRDWLFNLFNKGGDLAAGYTDAKNPQEAIDLFTKAIKARKFKTAAKYVKGNYKEQLERAHDAASSMGAVIDRIVTYAKNKGFDSEGAMTILYNLDPFPPYFSPAGAPVKDKKDETKAIGNLKMEWTYPTDPREGATLAKLNYPFNALVPVTWKAGVSVGLIEETAGDAKVWKVFIDV